MPSYSDMVICPFYECKSQHNSLITCEGLSVEVMTVVRFGTKEERDTWMKKYCDTYDYICCPYARVIQEKYEKEIELCRNQQKKS